MNDQIRPSRRAMLAGGAAALGGAMLTAAGDAGASSGTDPLRKPRSSDGEGGSLLDRIVSDGTVRVGVDLGFAPLQYRDPDTNEPTRVGIKTEADGRRVRIGRKSGAVVDK